MLAGPVYPISQGSMPCSSHHSLLTISLLTNNKFGQKMGDRKRQKTIVIGAGPVGALAALYAGQRGHDVEVYELRGGMSN